MMGIVNIDTAGIGGLASGLGQLAKDIRVAITGVDPAKQAEIAAKLAELETSAMLAQNEVNKIEAASTNMFIAGARPAILWIGGIVILYNYVVAPLLKAAGVALPDLALNDLWPVITGILGLGTMRTVEKINGAVGRH